MAAEAAKGKSRARPAVELSNGPALGIAARRMDREHDDQARAPLGTRPHPIYFAGAAGWVAFVALVVLLLVRHNELAPSTNWAIGGAGVLVAIMGVIGPVTRWRRMWIEIDGGDARCTSGVLRASTVGVNLDRARTVTIETGVAGRWLDYGRLRVVDEVGTTHVFPPMGAAALQAALSARSRRSRARRDRRDS